MGRLSAEVQMPVSRTSFGDVWVDVNVIRNNSRDID
jgi:hypothetical protein